MFGNFLYVDRGWVSNQSVVEIPVKDENKNLKRRKIKKHYFLNLLENVVCGISLHWMNKMCGHVC